MIFSRIQKPRFTTNLIILFIALQTSACTTEDRINTATGITGLDNGTVNGTNTSNATTFSGIDSGSVIEDDDPDKNNLLEINGKLNIASSTNSEITFVADTITGNYGSIAIDTAGNWNYAANNNQTIIQNLTADETLTDKLNVSSSNGATRTITITIIGINETSTTPAAANQPAVISGVDTGSVMEDVDPNNNKLLEVSAKLNISDSDAGEAAFIANTVNGRYGNLVIHTTGNWHYAADNTQAVIQNLATGSTLSDKLTVSSIDGTTHTITITIIGVDEVITNSPAIISGVSTGSVTEDVDPNNNKLLEVGAKLNISDSNPGEAAFIAKTINGNYGSLVIDAAGNWHYAADNTQAVIQNLATGSTLSDKLTVSSIDGTTHTITITIIGVDEPLTTANVTLSWVAPVAREDNTAISLSAIASYKIYYGTKQGQYTNSTTINDGSATGYTFANFNSGTYYFVVTTLDIDGRESQYSTQVTITI